jgi:NADH-quinone oxidoreductase subunit K
MNLDIFDYLHLGIALCCLGMAGILINKRSMLISLMSIELMLYGLDFFTIIASIKLDDIGGQILALFIVTLAAAESAIALALLMAYFKVYGNILIDLNLDELNSNKKIK